MRNVKYIFSDMAEIRKTLRGKSIYLFLDFDGTLAPIRRTPGEADMGKGTKTLLRKLSAIRNCRLAIVSGRALDDVAERVGLKNIVYVGNHGLEIRGPKIRYQDPVPKRYREKLEEIKGKLEDSLSSIKGVLVEDKGFSLSVHYRMAARKDVKRIKYEVRAALLLYELRNNVQIKPGKMVLEIRPPISWDKGKVALWLLGRRLFFARNEKKEVIPVYIGDDVTDEDAFVSLKDKGITIFVGKPGHTKAHFYVKDVKEVIRFLKEILGILNGGRKHYRENLK